jgi:CheY-like chemotaxis protein
MRSLVVDDEFVALSKMVLLMKAYGPCDAATHGEQAMTMIRAAIEEDMPYDLIALDINMPGTNGLQLLQTINSEEQCRRSPPVRKIVVSAASSRTNVTRAMERHCEAFLVKPVQRELLNATLEKLGFQPEKEAEEAGSQLLDAELAEAASDSEPSRIQAAHSARA